MTLRKCTGGCHCGDVRFTAMIDLAAPTIRCNCSICTRSRAWIAPLPPGDFALQAGSDAVTEYRFGAGVITHCFCRRCGVKTHGRITGDSGAEDFIAVSVQCLDLDPDVLETIPRSCVDGRADRQDRAPDRLAYL